MASYPTSVKSFTTKNTGDVIAASHVGDLQDEVNAIEAGLLNGTAPLNSSKSTLATLSVTGVMGVTGDSTLQSTVNMTRANITSLNAGGSTLATLNMTAGSTFAIRPITPPPTCAIAYRDSTYAAGSSAISTIAWNAEHLSIGGLWSSGTTPERFTPQSTGLYRFTFQAAIPGLNSTIQTIQLSLVDSSGTAIGVHRSVWSTLITGQTYQVTALKRYDVTGGWVTALFQTDGASTMSLSSGVGQTWASVEKL